MADIANTGLSVADERLLRGQLALFWDRSTRQQRNDYANILVFMILDNDDPIASAALQVIIYEIVRDRRTQLPWSSEYGDDLRENVAVAVIEKLCRSRPPREGEAPRKWARLMLYDETCPKQGGNFHAWLHTVAYRTALDVLRQHPMIGRKPPGDHARATWRDVAFDEFNDNRLAIERWYDEISPIRRLCIFRELAAALEILQNLPESEWRELALSLTGKGNREIADLVGSTPEAVRKRVSRLKRKLRRLVRGDDEPS